MADIETLGEQVKSSATGGQPNFTRAMADLASTPSLMGQIGAQVASAATMKLMEKKGTELGNDPDGNLPILPINDYLKQMESSYNHQSQAVLSLRGQQAIDQANEVMQQNPNITSGDIQAYKQNLDASLSEIAKLAPDGVRANLANSFATTMQHNTHQYATKMIAQQRQEMSNTQEAYITEQQSKMQDLGISGADDYAMEDAYANALNQINDRREQKLSTPQEHQAELKKLDILYHQSKLTRDAFEAQKKHGNEGAEKFLAELPDKQPEKMSYADYSTVMSGVARAVAQREQLKASNRSMIMSEAVANTAVTGQPPTPAQQEHMKEALTTQQFNETMLRINSSLTKGNAKLSAEDYLYANRNNTEAWFEAGAKAQKATFARMTDDIRNNAASKGQEMSEIQAMTEASKSIPYPTNVYPQHLALKISSGNPKEVMEAAVAYEHMSGGDYNQSAKVSGLDDRAKVAAELVNMMSSSGLDPAEQVSLARNVAYNNKKEANEENQRAYYEFTKSKLSTQGQKKKFLNDITGTIESDLVHDGDSLFQNVKAVHEKFYMLAGSNNEAAMSLTKKYVDAHYGYSYVNGTKEYVLNPIERMAGMETAQSIPLIHEDAVTSIGEQLKYNNEQYASGASDIKYELQMPQSKSGVPLTYDNYYKLLQASVEAKGKDNERQATKEFHKFRDDYYAPKPVNVKVTRRNGDSEETEDMQLNIYPTRNMQQSEDHSTIGGFDVSLKGKNGLPVNFSGWTSGMSNRVYFKANVAKINERAGSMPIKDYVPEHMQNRAEYGFGSMALIQEAAKNKGW